MLSSHQGQLSYISPLEPDEGTPSSTGAESFKSFIYSSYSVRLVMYMKSVISQQPRDRDYYSEVRKLKLRVTLVGPVCWDSDPGPCSPRACALGVMPSLRRDGTDVCAAAVSQQRGARSLRNSKQAFRAEQCQEHHARGV